MPSLLPIALAGLAATAPLPLQEEWEPTAADIPRYEVVVSYSPAGGLGEEPGICRRDPSDVIRVGDAWYVWYTKVVRERCQPGRHGYPSGYQGTVWGAISRDEGATWKELGEAVPAGSAGAFDCTATFTPNILVWEGEYYLYYTAVGPEFDNGPYEDRNRTSIGLSVAASPHGPWKKVSSDPVLRSTRDPERFDSYRVDDACFLIRDDRIWMYYKGRQWENTPGNTRMGVATADRPEGPFARLNEGRCVQDSGHEVLVWPHAEGVMSLVSATGPRGRTLQWAPDGLRFEVVGELPEDYPRAPGLYRPDLTSIALGEEHAPWGIAMKTYRGDPHLHRFELRLTPAGEDR